MKYYHRLHDVVIMRHDREQKGKGELANKAS